MKHLLLIASCAMALQVQAQTKTTYFSKGKKSFEGNYTMGYNVQDNRDLYNFDTAADIRKLNGINMAFRNSAREVPLSRVYDGKCTFYYDNGKVSYSGTYTAGLKTGLFVYMYYDGNKEAEYNYVHGMADGKWKAWHTNGKLRSEQSYVALTEAEMDTIYSRKLAGGNPFMVSSVMKDRGNLRTFANDSLRKAQPNTFTRFADVESSFYKESHWNGDFVSYYESGAKCTEMHYKNDVRTGKWMYWSEEGKIKAVLTFTDGKISDIVNNMSPDEDKTIHSGARQRPAPPMQKGPGMQPGGLDSMRAAMREKAMGKYPRPDQPAKASVDVNTYMREHVVYPEAAKEKKVMGMVLVRFVVNEDGTTSDFEVMRGLGEGCDEAAIKAVQGMPAWKPGMKDGKPVKSQTMVPVQFRPVPTAPAKK
jgi:TonB family protein